ncbi:MAG: hypothetical protein LIR50_05830 [Bacillota bacterium]|nr:hypothetical protein [Bacillota bacterium]
MILKNLLGITAANTKISVLFKSEELAESGSAYELYTKGKYRGKKILRQEIIKERLFIIIDF